MTGILEPVPEPGPGPGIFDRDRDHQKNVVPDISESDLIHTPF